VSRHDALRAEFVEAIAVWLEDDDEVRIVNLADRLVHLVVLHGLLPEVERGEAP
jgi:hypothetical protein